MNRHLTTLAFIFGLAVIGSAAFARAPAPQPFTLLVIPERVNLVQASFDLITQREVAMVAYRGDASGTPVLHAWTGSRWIAITKEEYRGGGFLEGQPDRIILVGDQRLLPESLVNASNWGPLVLTVLTTDTDEFLNHVGRMFEFTAEEWQWFAKRYNMALEDLSPPREQASWYDQMSEALQQTPRRRVSDVPPPPAEPVPVRLTPAPAEFEAPEEPESAVTDTPEERGLLK